MPSPNDYYTDCHGLEQEAKGTKSFTAGVHTIGILGQRVEVQCQSEGWTVIQSRGQHGNPSKYFLRGWDDYRKGFGEPGERFTCVEDVARSRRYHLFLAY